MNRFQTVCSAILTPVLFATVLCLVTLVKPITALPVDDELTLQINSYEKEIAILSTQVCGGAKLSDAAELKRLREDRDSLMRDSASLVALLEQENSSLDRISIPTSQRSALREQIRSEQASLKSACPALRASIQSAEASGSSTTSSGSTADLTHGAAPKFSSACETPGPNDIFPLDPEGNVRHE